MNAPPAQAIRFTVGTDSFGADLARIKEIIEPQPVKPFPRAPRFIDGVIEVRGTVIPAMDLNRRLGAPASGEASERRYIIASIAGKLLALGVDGVSEIMRVDPAGYRAVPSLLRRPETRYITGVVRQGKDMVLMLDLERLIATEEEASITGIRELAKAAEAAPPAPSDAGEAKP